MDITKEFLKNEYKIDAEIIKLSDMAEEYVRDEFKKIDELCEYRQYKLLKAFNKHKISSVHFESTTGYGYDDAGREALDALYADIFECEDALVRHNIISGTHALTIALFGVLRPGDTLAAITGKPYDTLEEVIGIRGDSKSSLKDFGIGYKQVDLLSSGDVDFDAVKGTLTKDVKAVLIQKSKGYSWRKSLSSEEIGETVKFVKKINPNIVCIVDNCYGEFTELHEPTYYGADLAVGSLIKNPGGGIAPTGGYIAGKKNLVELCAYRLTSPGIGKECGASLGLNKSMIQGLFFAPSAVASALKAALFTSRLYQLAGFKVNPEPCEKRTDIIQAIELCEEKKLISFCQGIQKGSPIDSFVMTEPWDMPGYENKVIMAAGAFTQGASIELSADGPIKPPFIAFMQGGLTYSSAKLGIILSLQNVKHCSIIK